MPSVYFPKRHSDFLKNQKIQPLLKFKNSTILQKITNKPSKAVNKLDLSNRLVKAIRTPRF